MATLYGLGSCEGITAYVLTKRRRYSDQEWAQIKDDLAKSSTIYIGNLSFFTTEEQLHELFVMLGPVKNIVMGLNSRTKEPCGFAFVQFYTHDDAKAAVNYINGLKIDSRSIKIDIDVGFSDGRQFGRGKAGGQVRDEFRQDYDYGRGGWGALKQAAMSTSGVEEPVIVRPQPSSTVDLTASSMISE